MTVGGILISSVKVPAALTWLKW